jgi:hypothetical protein
MVVDIVVYTEATNKVKGGTKREVKVDGMGVGRCDKGKWLPLCTPSCRTFYYKQTFIL